MSHYTIEYHNSIDEHFEIGTYADDSFEAANNVREDVPYLREHPFYVDKIIKLED